MTKLKPGQVTAKRAYEMADSLARTSKELSYTSKRLKDRATSSSEKKKEYLRKNPSTLNLTGLPGEKVGSTITGVKQMKSTSDKYKKMADANMAKADRFTKAANAATGRDKPLPSSDGILSTIKNWFE